MWISELGIHYKLGVDGLNLFLILLTRSSSSPATLWAMGREWEPQEGRFFFFLGLADTRCSARCWRRTSRCSSRSST
jgi:NADH-quinone oxidoreductase subunit M